MGRTGPMSFTGPTGYTGIIGSNSRTGPTGQTGRTGSIYAIGVPGIFTGVIPSNTWTVTDELSTTRQIFSRPMTQNVYLNDAPMNTNATTNGYPANNTTYTFGKQSDPEYLALVKTDVSSYGAILSRNLKEWSSIIQGSGSANIPSRVLWDGQKWIVTSNTATLLYSYDNVSFTTVTTPIIISAIVYNGSLYVGIGIGGLYYSYDSYNWLQSVSGSSLINNLSNIQVGKVIWNGNLWVAVGNGLAYTIAYSYDGINWTGVANSVTLFDLSGGAMDVAWNGSMFLAVGAKSTGTIIASSTDGINWSNTNTFTL
jgi:hypothetical protein